MRALRVFGGRGRAIAKQLRNFRSSITYKAEKVITQYALLMV